MHSTTFGTQNPHRVTRTACIRSRRLSLQRTPSWLQARLTNIRSFEYTLVQPLRRLQLPTGRVTVVIGLGEAIGMSPPGDSDMSEHYGSFVVSANHMALSTQHFGTRSCIEIVMPPWAAYECFGGANNDLGKRPTDFEDLFGKNSVRLLEQLAMQPDWTARSAILENFLAHRFNASLRTARAEIRWAWEQLESTGGSFPVTELSRRLGWSHRHFICCFRNVTGMTPKSAARYLRLDRANRLLATDMNLCTVAAHCGFSDQAHFTREFLGLAGCTPSEYREGWLSAAGRLAVAT